MGRFMTAIMMVLWRGRIKVSLADFIVAIALPSSGVSHETDVCSPNTTQTIASCCFMASFFWYKIDDINWKTANPLNSVGNSPNVFDV